MEVAGTLPAGRPSKTYSFADGFLKAAYSVAIASVGLWYPMLLQNIIRRGQYAGDPEQGVASVLAIFATVFAFRATDRLCCAYQDSRLPHKKKRLPLIAAIVFVCWAPAILWCIIMVGGLLTAYGR